MVRRKETENYEGTLLTCQLSEAFRGKGERRALGVRSSAFGEKKLGHVRCSEFGDKTLGERSWFGVRRASLLQRILSQDNC